MALFSNYEEAAVQEVIANRKKYKTDYGFITTGGEVRNDFGRAYDLLAKNKTNGGYWGSYNVCIDSKTYCNIDFMTHFLEKIAPETFLGTTKDFETKYGNLGPDPFVPIFKAVASLKNMGKLFAPPTNRRRLNSAVFSNREHGTIIVCMKNDEIKSKFVYSAFLAHVLSDIGLSKCIKFYPELMCAEFENSGISFKNITAWMEESIDAYWVVPSRHEQFFSMSPFILLEICNMLLSMYRNGLMIDSLEIKDFAFDEETLRPSLTNASRIRPACQGDTSNNLLFVFGNILLEMVNNCDRYTMDVLAQGDVLMRATANSSEYAPRSKSKLYGTCLNIMKICVFDAFNGGSLEDVQKTLVSIFFNGAEIMRVDEETEAVVFE